MPPEFFIDRSLGSDAVPSALRAVGADVVTMRELWGERAAQSLLDTEWIARLAEMNPIVLMKDDRIRYRPAEQRAFEQAGLRGFVLTNGNLNRAEMAAYFLTSLHTIRRLAASPGPYIYGCTGIALSDCGPDVAATSSKIIGYAVRHNGRSPY